MKNVFVIACLFTATLIFAACAKKNTATKTATETTTTFNSAVSPLLQAKCAPCHFPSKGGNKASFEDYASTMKHGAEILERIQRNPGERGFMPFKHDKLSAEEIALVKNWVDGGMKEN